MTTGIYTITNLINNKVYVGQSTNIEGRLIDHKCSLRSKTRSKAHTNQHLYTAVQKYGWSNFKTEIVQSTNTSDTNSLHELEALWMNLLGSLNPKLGYNLRSDVGGKCVHSEETKKLISKATTGILNGNYGNKWNNKQRSEMSKRMKLAIADKDGPYNEVWKSKLSKNSTRVWQNEDLKLQMSNNVSAANQKYNYEQYARDGVFIKRWLSVKEIVNENESYKWQNIYSVCNGHKPTYKGFIWKKVPMTEMDTRTSIMKTNGDHFRTTKTESLYTPKYLYTVTTPELEVLSCDSKKLTKLGLKHHASVFKHKNSNKILYKGFTIVRIKNGRQNR